MSPMTIQTLGLKLLDQRGERGIREVAKEIGISHATLSRVERGFLPDLDTFSKVCRWLNVDPGRILQVRSPGDAAEAPSAAVHFKKESTVSPRMAQALAQLILAAQRAVLASQGSD